MKLLAKNSNACDHNPPTLQADRRTDGQLTMAIPCAVQIMLRGISDDSALAGELCDSYSNHFGPTASRIKSSIARGQIESFGPESNHKMPQIVI